MAPAAVDWHLPGPRPTALEVATGVLCGTITEPPKPMRVGTPRASLEAVIRPYLARSPCVIAFSGGRDSSALLAVAVRLARREGLTEPVPATLEFASPATDERKWQERVLGDLRVADWVRIPVADELDMVGPVAAAGLRRHGLLYPANAHTIVPLAEQARGGAVLTGVGGDDVFGNWPWHDVGSLLAQRRPAQAADARRLAHILAPRCLRTEVLARREPLTLPWLRRRIRRDARMWLARELGSAPRTWAARMRWAACWRPWRATTASMELLGRDHGAAVGSPFLRPEFLAALARAGGARGWGDRTQTMRALFADVAGESILTRRSKAEFSEAFFGPHTRRFAGDWDGTCGLDGTLVDSDVLRRAWCAPRPHFLSSTALQAAWLARAT